MRLTKFNPETGQYEYKEPAKTQAEFNEQRKAVIQKLGEYEDKASEVKADTVRKMQERVEAKILEINGNLCGLLPFIDQIAKEMLEGEI